MKFQRYISLIIILSLITFVPSCAQSNKETNAVKMQEPIEKEAGYSFYNAFSMSKPVFTNAKEKVAFIAGKGYQEEEIIAWDLKTDRLINATRNFGQRSCYGRIIWSPQGDAIAAPLHPMPGGSEPLYVLSLTDGKQYEIGGGTVAEYAWSPDGTMLAYAGVDNHLYIANRDGTGTKQLTKNWHYSIQHITWWHDGGSTVIAFVAGWLIGEKNIYIAPLTASGEVQITKRGGYGALQLDEKEIGLIVYRLTDDKAFPMEKLSIAPQSHAEKFIEKVKEYMNLNLGSVEVLSCDRDKIDITRNGKRYLLTSARVEEFIFSQSLAHAKQVADSMPLTLNPDPSKVKPKGPMQDIPAKPVQLENMKVIAKATIHAATVRRTIEIGPLALEMLGVTVEGEQNNLSIRVAMRFYDMIGSCYLDPARSMSLPFGIQELYNPGNQTDIDKGIRGYYRSYAIAITQIKMDPATRVWSSFNLELVRYDEAQGIPTISNTEKSIK